MSPTVNEKSLWYSGPEIQPFHTALPAGVDQVIFNTSGRGRKTEVYTVVSSGKGADGLFLVPNK